MKEHMINTTNNSEFETKNNKNLVGVSNNKKGEFTQVPNEILEYLSQSDLTCRELRVCIFLIRELTGWDYKFKPIEIIEFTRGTKISAQKIHETLKSLINEKNLVLKKKIPKFRTPLYGLNEEFFGRVLVKTEPRNYFQQNSKVIDLVSFKLTNSVSLELSELVTQKKHESALRAAEQESKDTETNLNTLSKTKIDKNNWEDVRADLLKQYPNDANRLDGTYRQIQRNGYEQEGKPPKSINSVSAWLLWNYKNIRKEYAHHDRTVLKNVLYSNTV